MTPIADLVILACPVCNYDRVMPTWAIFTSLRLLVVLAIAYRRLDLVRTLGAFAAFEAAYYYAWRLAVWYSHPAVAEGFIQWLALASLLVLSIGIPAALFLFGISRVSYFRGSQSVPLTRKRASLLLPAMFILAVIQGI
jgi:uncharacterized membrane protein YesL